MSSDLSSMGTVDEGEENDFTCNDNDSEKIDRNFIIINTNARSLCPKISSLVDCFDELNAHVGVITETWLTDGEGLEEDVQGLAHGTGLGLIYKNRPANDRGFSHGGVAILFKSEDCSFSEVKLPKPGRFRSHHRYWYITGA